MTHESIKALERIVAICEGSENLTMRQIRIFDIALEGLGYIACQRSAIVEKWKAPHVERMQGKRDRMMVKQEGM